MWVLEAWTCGGVLSEEMGCICMDKFLRARAFPRSGESLCLNWQSSLGSTRAWATHGHSTVDVCVCARVCVASGLPGPADCSIAHLHMHTAHRDCQFFVRGWSSQIVGRAGTHMLYSHSTDKVLTSYTVR